MSTLDRYKKKGGFHSLLTLLETTIPEKREKFLKLIGEESLAWEAALRKKMLSMERICKWEASYLMEIFSHIPINNVAAIVAGLPPTQGQALLQNLELSQRRRVELQLKDTVYKVGEVNSSVMKLMTEIRSMAQSNKLKFEKIDVELVIPENYEELLGAAGYSVTDNDVADHFEPLKTDLNTKSGNQNADPKGDSNSPHLEQLTEEVMTLRRRVVQLSTENNKLSLENAAMKERLEQIRRIA